MHHLHDGGSAHHPPRAGCHVGGALARAHRRSRQEHLRVHHLHGARQGCAPHLARSASSASWPSAQPRASADADGEVAHARSTPWVCWPACGLLGYAWYAQAVLGLEPCPLCIFQRIGIALIGVLFLLAALHEPGRVGRRVSTGCCCCWRRCADRSALPARHVWIQHQPAGTVPACGASLAYMLEDLPLTAR